MSTETECAAALRAIAADVRAAGDVPLVILNRDGVAPAAITLADELWLIALRLDPAGTWAAPTESDPT